ncbi:MAG: hypothetical protein DRJ42_24085, partial [Deltaproteobacteria bacterium]
MDYLKGYRVFREDPEWVNKLLIGSMLLLSAMVVPLLGQLALVGWHALIMRRAVHGQDAPLPDLELNLDYLGKLVGLGFKGMIARFLWSLPVIALVLGLGLCLYVGIFTLVLGGVATAAESGESASVAGILAGACCAFGGYFAVMVISITATIPA